MNANVFVFTPRLFQGALEIRPGSCSYNCEQLNLLTGETRVRAQALLKGGGCLGILLFEIRDFCVLSKIYGQEIVQGLNDALLKEVHALSEEHVQGMSLVFLEAIESGKCLLGFGAANASMSGLDHMGSVMRLHLRIRLKQKAFDLTGQEIEIAMGAARVVPLGARSLEQAMHAAVADAQRMIRGNWKQAHTALVSEFRELLHGGVRALYQPIVDLRGGGVFACEALARGPAGSAFESPVMLFGVAEEHGLVFPLERACRTAALSGFNQAGRGDKLFVNVHPRTLVDPSFSPGETLRQLKTLGLEPHDVVLEITERHPTKDFSLFHRTLEHYRGEGYKVAVDDVGTGYSGLWSIAEIRPDFIKLDMSLIRGIDANPVKRALIETFLTFSDKVGCKIIAEGVETATELSSLVHMGIHFGQGYFLGRPASPCPDVSREAVGIIQTHKRRVSMEIKCSSPIGMHAEKAFQASADSSIGDLKRTFEALQSLSCVAVTCGARPVGMVTRHQMDRVLSTQYGQALYASRPVTKIMDSHPLIVDAATPVEVVAQAAMNRDGYKVYDHILVTREGALAGVASVQKILDALAQVQMEMAKGASPLSGLPGNVAIERELEARVVSQTPVSFIYADLDNFKAFNDSYGFKAGDEIILLTARILSWAIRRHGGSGDFLGHVGGDDFVMCVEPQRAERICRAAVRCFSRTVCRCYNEKDRKARYMQAKDRSGKLVRFPLVSLSLAIVDCHEPCSLGYVSQRSAQMKKYAKSKPGNVWVRDRRDAAEFEQEA